MHTEQVFPVVKITQIFSFGVIMLGACPVGSAFSFRAMYGCSLGLSFDLPGTPERWGPLTFSTPNPFPDIYNGQPVLIQLVQIRTGNAPT